MKKHLLSLGVVVVATLAGTWFVGWWCVPIIALVAGVALCAPSLVALGTTLAWALLLLADLLGGSIARVASVLSDLMGLPAPALIAVTLAFPALLGWSAASLGYAARTLRATTSLPPS